MVLGAGANRIGTPASTHCGSGIEAGWPLRPAPRHPARFRMAGVGAGVRERVTGPKPAPVGSADAYRC
jgi:hypothetical protein